MTVSRDLVWILLMTEVPCPPQKVVILWNPRVVFWRCSNPKLKLVQSQDPSSIPSRLGLWEEAGGWRRVGRTILTSQVGEVILLTIKPSTLDI
jgi:hypothetical protein